MTIRILQSLLGLGTYLLIFAKFKIATLKLDGRKDDFRAFLKIIPTEGAVVIVGANIGITTVPFINNKRDVFAYEPFKKNFQTLEKVLSNYPNNNTSTYQLAIGEKKGRGLICVPIIAGVIKHGLAYISDAKIKGFKKVQKYSVEMDRLDDRLELKEKKITAIKIVAENYELNILKGAEILLSEARPLIYCELWPNSQRLEVISFIESLKYHVYCRINNEFVLYSKCNYPGKNFYFIPTSEF